MQVKEQESKGLRKNFKVVVAAEQINKQTEKELAIAGERVKIPGFRPGFIPLKILQQRYGKSVQADVLKQVLNRASNEVITERKLRPVLTPQVTIDDYQEGGDLTFTMSFDAFPEVPDIAYDKITLDRKTFEVGDADIEQAAKQIADRSPKMVRVEDGKKSKNGNIVLIDFKGMIDGVAFEGGSANDFRLELGSNQFIEGFEAQLVGAKEGDDVDVKVTFPKDYPGEKVAGRDAVFAVKVKEIYSKEIPQIDEAFAKSHGFADIRAFQEAVRNQLIREYDQVVRGQLKKQLFDMLDEQYSFELPEDMVKSEFKTIWDRLLQAKAQGDESLVGKSDEELKEEYEQISERRVKLGLVLAEIGNRNKLQVTREEMTRAVVQQASMFPGQEKKVMEFYREHPDRVEDLRGPILEEKAVDFILGKVKFTDRKVALDELTDGEDEDEGENAQAKKPKAKAAKVSESEKEAKKPSEKAPAKKKSAK